MLLFCYKKDIMLSLSDKIRINVFEAFNSTSILIRESSGSVVECLTRDQGATGSSLTGVTVLWSLSKTHLS